MESEIIQAMSASDFFLTVKKAKKISLCHLRHPRQQIHMARHQMPSEAHEGHKMTEIVKLIYHNDTRHHTSGLVWDVQEKVILSVK